MDQESRGSHAALRIVAIVLVLAGAVGSLCFTLYAGRQNKSVLLMTLFSGWVLSPFLALLLAKVVFKRWLMSADVTRYVMMIIISLGSLLCYSGALGPIGPRPAFVYLMLPLISWLLMIVTVVIVRLRSPK